MLVARNTKNEIKVEINLNLSSYFSKTSTNSPSNSANEQSECRITPECSKTVDYMIISESTLNVENLRILKVIQLHFSCRSCEGINKLFAVMFPDNEISFNLKLSKTKYAYLMNYGIAPHFKSNLLKSINNSSFYSLSFDESLNNVLQSCQMDINIRYWNEAKNVVETRYLDSKFVSRLNADNLFEQLEYVLKELSESKILHLSMDGPSVNWNVLDKLDNYLNEKDIPSTIQIGSCHQHILHGIS